ncbi:MAG: hypothetical protein Q4E00_01950 [Actinomyces bowdenii]|nr:hypothetical protein [Actinomyces bowdenii]
MMSAEEVAREDLLTFLNAALASTVQAEFASTAAEQREALAFLHEYVRGNYRRLYARLLALGVNDANTMEIVVGLLSTGRQSPEDFRAEEGALLRAAVRALPPQRFWRLTARLRAERINNRRSRALVRDYIREHPDLAFQAVKYRGKVAGALRHAHLRAPGEVDRFLFGAHDQPFSTPILESYRRAHHSRSALAELPYTVAQGLAARHGMGTSETIEATRARLTSRERLRLARHSGQELVNPARQSLTELAIYLLSLPELAPPHLSWMPRAADRLLQRSGPLPLDGAVAAVLDNSYSSSGSRAKRGRPLAVAWAVDALLSAGVDCYRGWWTHPVPDDVPRPQGTTNLAERLLDALEWGATTVIVVSDGVENDPPGAFHAVLERARRLVPGLAVIHLNPVFDPRSLQVRSLSPLAPAIGLRSAEDLPAALGLARYLAGSQSLEALEAYLSGRVVEFIAAHRRPPSAARALGPDATIRL